MVPNSYENPYALEADIDEEDPEEKARKQIAARRIFFLLVGIAVLLVGIIVFELVEISLGGRI